MQGNNTTTGRIPREEYRLDLYSVLSDIKKQWIAILLLTVSAVLISYVMLASSARPVYKTSASVTVGYASEFPDINNEMAPNVYESLSYSGYGAKNLKALLGRSEIKTEAAKEFGEEGFRGSLSVEQLKDSNLVVISVSAGAPDASLKSTQAILQYLKNSKDELLGGLRINVIQEPRLTVIPVNMGSILKQSVTAGIAVFFLLFVLLALLSSVRYTVRNCAEAEPKLGVKLLAALPLEKKAAGELLITNPAVSTGFAEEVRSLAIRVMNEMEKKGHKVLLVSSAVDGEGKSTVAANIAAALSQMNRKAILADPAQLQENGASTEDPDEQIKKCLEQLKEKADFVIVDTVSAGAASDAAELARFADASLIVVREHFAKVVNIEKAIAALSGDTSMLGCAFNFARGNAVSADAAKRDNGGQYVR